MERKGFNVFIEILVVIEILVFRNNIKILVVEHSIKTNSGR